MNNFLEGKLDDGDIDFFRGVRELTWRSSTN